LQVIIDLKHFKTFLYISCLFRRKILTAALNSATMETRLFGTQFLRVLLRTRSPFFSKWGMELLVKQIEDVDKTISLAALNILEESVHDKVL